MYSQIAFSPAHRGFRISCGFACAMIAAACYYHVKHLLIPDADFGIVRCLRNYIAVALCLAVLSVVELVAMAHENEWLLIVSGIGLCAVTLALVPVMDRG